jgi:hypothetical protein
MTTPGLIQLDALGHNGAYHAHTRVTVADVTGKPMAELSLVPRLFVHRSIAALRGAETVPADRLAAALTQAGRAFATASINGLSVQDYQHAVSRVSGLPISVVRATTDMIAYAAAEAYGVTQSARPVGAVNEWRDPATRTGRAVWTRRGHVFAVHASGNHPGVHGLWLEALALGYRWPCARPSGSHSRPTG